MISNGQLSSFPRQRRRVIFPLASLHSRKNRSGGIDAKNKNKKSKIHKHWRNARLYVALQRRFAAIGISFLIPNQNKALLVFRSHQKTRKGKKGKFPILGWTAQG
jgi:hypothetical protein